MSSLKMPRVKSAACGLLFLFSFITAFGQTQVGFIEPQNAVEYINLYNKGVELYKSGQDEKAIEAFQMVLRFNPKDDDAYYYLALAYHASNQQQKAITAYRQAIKLKPSNAELQSRLCSALLEVRRLWEANEPCKQAVRLEPKNPAYYVKFGMFHWASDNYESAAQAFKLAIQLKPDFAEAHHKLGLACYNLGLYKEAIESLKWAVHLDPADVTAQLSLLEISANLRSIDNTTRFRKDSSSYQSLGNALRILGRYREAIEALKQAVHHERYNAKIYGDLGLAYYVSGLYEDAIAAYKRAIAINPKLTEAHKQLTWIYHYLGKNMRVSKIR